MWDKALKNFSIVTILLVTLTLISCGETYKYVECGEILMTARNLHHDYYEAYDAGNCEELVGIMDEIIAEYKKAKICKDFKALVESEGFDSANEYFEALEQDAIADTEECENEPT